MTFKRNHSKALDFQIVQFKNGRGVVFEDLYSRNSVQNSQNSQYIGQSCLLLLVKSLYFSKDSTNFC